MKILGFMGRSGSGKDLCSYIVTEQFNGFISVALADPMKRYLHTLFSFTNLQLWGPSDYRNEAVPVDWSKAAHILKGPQTLKWVQELLSGDLNETHTYYMREVLADWFEFCRSLAHAEYEGRLSPRIALQSLGTEYGRGFRQSIWVDYLFAQVVDPMSAPAFKYIKTEGLRRVNGVSGIVVTDVRFLNEVKAIQASNPAGRIIKLIRISRENKESETDKQGLAKHASEVELMSIPLDTFDEVLRLREGVDYVTKDVVDMVNSWEDD